MPKKSTDKPLPGTLQEYGSNCKRGLIFIKCIWPKEVSILKSKDISEVIAAPAGEPQCLWGHINNELRYHLHIPLIQAQTIICAWERHFSYVGHIFKTKSAFKDISLMQYSRVALFYNAAWATFGYVTNQDDLVLKLAKESMPTLVKFSPGTCLP